jgi:hypothetical protein
MDKIKNTYDYFGKITKIEHYRNGLCHNENGPAVICVRTDGTIWVEHWFIDGKRSSCHLV